MRIVQESRIAAPPAVVFAFFESPGALERLTPPWEKVELVSGGDSIRPGSRAVLRTRLGLFHLRWEAEHTEYEQGRMFADRQVSGPFASWYHRHLFLDDGAGGTILRDEVDYEPPMGALGHWLGGGFLENKLRKLFEYRHETTRRIVEAGDFLGTRSHECMIPFVSSGVQSVKKAGLSEIREWTFARFAYGIVESYEERANRDSDGEFACRSGSRQG